jgi:hypothetical protein
LIRTLLRFDKSAVPFQSGGLIGSSRARSLDDVADFDVVQLFVDLRFLTKRMGKAGSMAVSTSAIWSHGPAMFQTMP